MTYKAKKGDVIAIEKLHSCHSIGMARTEWRDWTLGRAHKVSRKGIVEQFSLGNGGLFYSIDRTVRIATIGDDDKRAAAERLLQIKGSEPFETAEALKEAIIAA
jgi:hypothetical protein